MPHDWKSVTLKQNDVNGPVECDIICEECGASQHDENKDSECTPITDNYGADGSGGW